MYCKKCITYCRCRSVIIDILYKHKPTTPTYSLYIATKDYLAPKCSIFSDYVVEKTDHEEEFFAVVIILCNILVTQFDLGEIINGM